ncbi:MAG: EI24 domain-containing protein [Mariprofundaceae bacterium]|nr:EI24 domain-containing protein [Mariprofundaceae bacterium]
MFQGSFKLLSGIRLLLSKAELRAILWKILALLTVLMLLLMASVFFLFDVMMQAWLPDGEVWYWVILSWVIWGITIIFTIFIGIIGLTALASAAVAPWLDNLAVRTEHMYGIARPENSAPWWKQCVTALIHSIRPSYILLIWGIAALIISIIPILGPIAAAIIWTYASIHFLCFELMDTTATRQGWNFTQRKTQLKARPFFWLGFGGLAMLLMLIPLMNILVIPAAVVALSQPENMKEHPNSFNYQ